MEAIKIEVRGAGSVTLPDGRGVPGLFANCVVVVDPDSGSVLRVEPFPQPEGDQLVDFSGESNESEVEG